MAELANAPDLKSVNPKGYVGSRPTVVVYSFNCGQLVKVAAVATGGNGGGRNDFAQAGGKEVNKLVEALKLVEEKIKCDI